MITADQTIISSHNRKSIRLSGYDYRQAGAYFVTLVVKNRAEIFGQIENGKMISNSIGKIMEEKWIWLADRYPYVELGSYCLMPNHFHGILMIVGSQEEEQDGNGRREDNSAGVGARRDAPLQETRGFAKPQRTSTEKIKPLGGLVGAFKTVSTKWINDLRGTQGIAVWQRNYYERIIRNDAELESISLYIVNNPVNWEMDQENPHLGEGDHHG